MSCDLTMAGLSIAITSMSEQILFFINWILDIGYRYNAKPILFIEKTPFIFLFEFYAVWFRGYLTTTKSSIIVDNRLAYNAAFNGIVSMFYTGTLPNLYKANYYINRVNKH